MIDAIIISTLTGTLVCTLLLVLKNKLLSLLGGRFLYYISLFAMLIFLLPVNIQKIELPAIYNSYSGEAALSDITAAETEVTETAKHEETIQNFAQTPVMPKPVKKKQTNNPITMQEMLISIWIIGFVISMSRYFISYLMFRKRICSFKVCERINGVEIIKSPLISSPMIFGFFRATLAVPETEMAKDDYELALRHEMVHYRRHDSWLKLFAVTVNCIYWFNPITYLMVNLVGEACEYACDEAVVREMDLSERRKYSEMILSVVCQSSPALSSNMAKNKKQLFRRFEMIMKKKKVSIFTVAASIALVLTATCSSVVLANEVAPTVAALLKDDYVYISNYGNGEYNDCIPVEKDGVHYLPLREFMNKSDIENDKIMYSNGEITIEIWSNTRKMITTMVPNGEEMVNADRNETIIPSRLIWTTSCSINSKTVIIDGNEYTLKNPIYLEKGTTYVPYEYIRLLADYEELRKKNDSNDWTHKFIGVLKYGYDSFESEYYCDDVGITSLPREKVFDENALIAVWAYYSQNADISLKKTGYRTEFNATFDYIDMNNQEIKGNAEIVLNKVTRIYSKGSDIEGLFTVKIDGETIYENKKGYITNLPLPAGEGIVDHGETVVEVGQAKLGVFFTGFGLESSAEYSALSMRNREIARKADTKALGLFPTEVKLNGNNVIQTEKSNYIQYNTNDRYAEIRLGFYEYLDDERSWRNDYQITLYENSDIKVIDENTYSGHFFLEKNQTRIDSFDAIITLLPDNKFEFKSNDGMYIVRGTIGEFIPQWEWTEEQKNAPVPAVVMIDE